MPNPRFFEHTNSTSSCNMRSLGQGTRDSSNVTGRFPASRINADPWTGSAASSCVIVGVASGRSAILSLPRPAGF
jgi:hypothetical protein